MERFLPLSSVTTDPREAIKIIADAMIKSRPTGKVANRPYRHGDVYTYHMYGIRVDLKKLYPEAKPGDTVYVSAVLDSSSDTDASIRIFNETGDVSVFLNGKELSRHPEVTQKFFTHFEKGPGNFLTIKARCTSDEKFEFCFAPTTIYHSSWAKWYLLNVHVKSPIAAFRGEEGLGISRLYAEGEEFDGEYVYPTAPVKKEKIDFSEIYPNAKGKIAYALTYATSDTEFLIKTDSVAKIFVNGAEVECGRLVLAEGDEVMVKLLRGDSWSFSFEGEGIGLPAVETQRGIGDKWMTLGTFSEGGKMNCSFGPELGVQLVRPYIGADGEQTFWKLDAENDYIRPYLQTCCYGQWYYALMVGTHGLLRAGEALDCPEYRDYFMGSEEVISKYFEYVGYDQRKFGRASFMEYAALTPDLDQIGSMGRNLCEYYKLNPTPEALAAIDVLAEGARTKIPRFEDGTYHRPKDMWSDDMFMSCPFLVRLGKIKRSCYYYEEVIRQFRGFHKRLWMKDEKIMSHIFFLDDEKPNNIPWGRGNGWVYISLADALENIPEGFEGRDFLMEFYHDFTEGLLGLQDSDGLFHQVLNRPDSYQETSCTAMFMLGLCRGIKNGWLDKETYMPKVERAYMGLLNKKISSGGNVYDVCRGSSNSKTVEYYMNLGAIDNDDHGTGVILTAISEMLKII